MQLEFLHGSMVHGDCTPICHGTSRNVRIYPLINNIGTVYFHHGDNK